MSQAAGVHIGHCWSCRVPVMLKFYEDVDEQDDSNRCPHCGKDKWFHCMRILPAEAHGCLIPVEEHAE